MTAVQTTMDILEDQIGSLSRDICLKAYKILMQSYKTALAAIWDSAQNANITVILETVEDKEMSELKKMVKRLQLPTPTVQVVKEKREVPTLETITGLMMAKLPTQNMPNTAVCEKIGYIFSKLSGASKAYGEATEALAEVSTDVSPEHYMLLLSAATTPTVQIVVPPMMISPITTHPPPTPDTATTLGRTAIINATKSKVLPNPNSSCFSECVTTIQQGYWWLPFMRHLKRSSSTQRIQEWSSPWLLSVMYHNYQKPLQALNTAQDRIIINPNLNQ